MNCADLHIHSCHSCDGEFTPEAIVGICQTRKIPLFALTDHNTVKGIEATALHAEKAEIPFIPGIEIDCNFEGTDLHLLGYGIDRHSADFEMLEQDFTAKVTESFSQMIANLQRLGFTIDAAAVLAHANGKLPTPELIAEVMLSDEKYAVAPLAPYMKGGARSDMPYINFYLDYFTQGKPAFVPIRYMHFAQAVEMIRDNGGIPIVAHPGLNFKGHERTVEKLLEKGAAGLEAFNNYHDMEQIGYFASAAQQKRGLITCGSDFHGKTKPLIEIGQFRMCRGFESHLEHSIEQIKVR